MNNDKAIRAALLTAKSPRKDTASENIADYVADLLRQGRTSEITDDLMVQADPQRLHKHYTSGNTGPVLPMDYASRMERAGNMGMTNKVFHGTNREFNAFDLEKHGTRTDEGWFGRGSYFSGEPEIASGYAGGKTGASVIPAVVRSDSPWDTTHQSFSQDYVDRLKRDEGTDAIRRYDNESLADKVPPKEMVSYDPTNIRSQFARFDPRLSHLSDLNAATGGTIDGATLEKARHTAAVQRAGGQQFPSQYLPNVPRAVHADGGRENGDFEVGKKYSGIIPQIKYLPIHAIKRQPSDYEVSHVSDDVAKNMDFSEPVDVTAFRYGSDHSEDTPETALQNGHHRLAAAHQTGRPHLPVKLTAINAKGERLNALKAISDEIERGMIIKAEGGKVDHFKDGGSVPNSYANGGSDNDDGITAYHGSPHDFNQFDISKLGTGEGAQSYGHGLYFARNEKVAKGYRDALTDPDQVPLHFQGRPIDTPWNADIRSRWPEHFAGKSEAHQDAMEEALGNLSQVNHIRDVPNVVSGMSPAAQSIYHRVIRKDLIKPDTGKGHMYKVKLHVKPEELLDWDKPLSQQHPNVQEAIKAAGIDAGARAWENGADMGNGSRLIVTPHPDLPEDKEFTKYEMQLAGGARFGLSRNDVARLLGNGNDLTGAQLHQRLVDMGNRQGAIGEHLRAGNPMKRGDKWAAEALMRHGIKGIRYLDAGSRNLSDGDPTHNYVMFRHDPVEVTDKYEYGGTVAIPKARNISPALAVTRRFTKDAVGATLALKSKGK